MSTPISPLHEPYPRPPYLEHPYAGQLRVPVRPDLNGLTGPTPGAARGPQWRRTSHGRFVPAATPQSTEQLTLEAAFALPRSVWTRPDPVDGEQGGVIGWAALRWYGARWFDGALDGTEPITLATRGRTSRGRPGIAVCEDRFIGTDFTRSLGIPMATPTAATWHAAAHADNVWAATRILDMAAYDGLIDLAAFAEYVTRKVTWTGVPQVREALTLASANSWSPQESTTRLVWVLLAGLPPVLPNCPVFDERRRLLAVVDLLEPISGLVVEYDGRHHLDLDQRHLDIGRHEELLAHGLRPLVVVSRDLDQPHELAHRFRMAYAARLDEMPRRRWTLERPPGWTVRHPSRLRAQRLLSAG